MSHVLQWSFSRCVAPARTVQRDGVPVPGQLQYAGRHRSKSSDDTQGMDARMKSPLRDIVPYRQGESRITGHDRIVKLSSNELPYPPSPAAIRAFHETERSLNRYPDGEQQGLRHALSEQHDVPLENILAGSGSEEAIGLVIRATLSPGDEMIVSENSFLMTEIHARSVDACIVRCSESDCRVDIDAMLAATTERTRIVYLCSPNNPTGTYTTGSELRRLSSRLPRNVLLVIDAAYAEFADAPDYSTGQSLFSPQGSVTVTRTLSKAYGLAALRIGWALVPDRILDAVNRLRSPFNANSAAQNAAAAAVRDQAYLEQSVARIRSTRDRFVSELRAIGIDVVPSQANFVLLRFAENSDDAAALDAALRKAGILGRPVAGGENEFRITIGTEEEMEHTLSVIHRWTGSRKVAG